MNISPVEPFLRRDYRRPRPLDWKVVGIVIAGAVLMFAGLFILMIEWGATHAHAETINHFATVLKGGHMFTLKDVCGRL